MALSDIYKKASLVQIPSGYKSGTLYSVVPNTSVGDFIVTGDPQGEATRVNKDGLIESVAADVPRLNYDFTNPEDPHLLLEPERTNIYTYSQDLNQGTTLTNTSVDNDNTTSPDGSLTGNKLTQTSGAFVRKNLSVVLSGTYAWSFFAKKGDLRYLNARSLFVLNGTTPANGNTIIDLDTNTIAYKGTNVTSASIEQYPNDWIKVEIVATDNATGSGDFVDFFFTDSDTSTQSTGVAGNGFIWGVQFEAGSYPTSYIPTAGNAVTRAADTCEKSSVASGIIGQTEGVIFLDFENYGQIGTSYGNHFKIESAGNNDRVAIQSDATSLNRLILVINDGSSTFFQPREDISLGRNKIAIKYKSGDIDAYINGVKEQASTTSFSFANTLNKIYIGQPNKVHQAMIFNEALTDAELITLTT